MKILTTSQIAKVIGIRLKKIRQEKEFSQRKVAEFIGCDRSTISNWERGITSPDLVYLIMLSKFYEVDISYFIKPIQVAMESDA